ncbi:MAG: transcriptional regulator [Rhodobacterales bacterium]|nr:MAG: transcriptional regulator [Rhodobacterales bacterium]
MPLDTAFTALADPTRRAILAHLAAHGEASVAEIAAPFPISQPAVSRHLKVLEDAGLIETRIKGSARPRRLNATRMREVRDWLTQLQTTFDANFARLDALLEE